MDQAAGFILPFLPAVRRSADALRRQAAISAAAAQMLLVEELLAEHDPSAPAQARLLTNLSERLAGADSPAVLLARRLQSQADAQQPSAPAWSTYTNVRFGFSICYPQDIFTPEGESANSDGQRFKGPDGSILIVYGANDSMGDSLDDHLKQAAARLAGKEGKVTYTAKKETWAVASGRNGETVFYVKTTRAASQFKSFELTYKNSQTGIFSQVLPKISACFVSTAPVDVR